MHWFTNIEASHGRDLAVAVSAWDYLIIPPGKLVFVLIASLAVLTSYLYIYTHKHAVTPVTPREAGLTDLTQPCQPSEQQP